MVQKHARNFCKFFIAWILKKSIPFSTSAHQLPGSQVLQGLPYTLMSEEGVQFSASQARFTEQETNQQLEKHSIKLVLQGELPLAMQICH